MPIPLFSSESDLSRIRTIVSKPQDLLYSVWDTRDLHEVYRRTEELRSRIASAPTHLWDSPISVWDSPISVNERRAIQLYLNAFPYWESSGLLIKYLETLNLHLELHCYKRARSCFEYDLYEPCNAMLRSFLQSLLMTIYERVKNQKAKGIGSAIDLLHNIGLISKENKKWLRKTVLEFHTNGSHPGYSSKEEANQRIRYATNIGHFLIKDYCDYRKQTRQ